MQTKKIKVTNVYNRTKEASKKEDIHTIVNKGGAGSSKSYSMIQFFTFERLLQIPNYKLLVLRKTRKSLKLSLYEDWMDFLKQIGIYDIKKNNKTDLRYTFDNGSYVLFGGLDNEEKIKSTEWHDILLEEGNEFSRKNYLFLKTRLYRGKLSAANHNPKIYINLNPIDCWLREEESTEGYEFIDSTVEDNPFANQAYKDTLNALAEEDKTYYQIYRHGNWALPEDLIYEQYERIEDYPEDKYFDDIIYGIDFGFNNPAAVVKIGIKDSRKLYEKEILYRTGLTNSELIEAVKSRIEKDQLRKNWYADSAEPDRIKEFYNAGFNIRGANKGKNSVKDGIDYVKRFHRLTDESSTDLIKENSTYKWKEDRQGNIIDEPVAYKDHLMDAERYAIYTHFKGQLNMPSISEIVKDINNAPDRQTTRENVV